MLLNKKSWNYFIILFKNVQNEIKALAQENLIILKRLLDKTPNIDNQKLKKDFEKHQEYKNNICKFPTIGLNKKKRESNPTTGSLEYKNNTKTLPSIYRNTSFCVSIIWTVC